MDHHSEDAAPMSSIIGSGVSDIQVSVVLMNYRNQPEIATLELAARRVAAMFRVSMPLARETCRLAGIGGRA